MTNNMSFFSPCFFKVDSLNFGIFFLVVRCRPPPISCRHHIGWLYVCVCVCVCRIWWFIFNINTEKERKNEKKRKPNPIFIHLYEFCSRFFTPIKKQLKNQKRCKAKSNCKSLGPRNLLYFHHHHFSPFSLSTLTHTGVVALLSSRITLQMEYRLGEWMNFFSLYTRN